jgi:hypothetical protein
MLSNKRIVKKEFSRILSTINLCVEMKKLTTKNNIVCVKLSIKTNNLQKINQWMHRRRYIFKFISCRE